jgi:hypothetical protein
MLVIALLLKATIKHKALDVRIGRIGTIDYTSNKVTESNGSAFINSGECFEGLKKQTLGIQTPWSGFDETFTIILQLVVLFADKWTTTSAEIIKSIRKPG